MPDDGSLYQTIRQAIVDHLQVVAQYDGHLREMCPHALGTKDGQPCALFYQFAGKSKGALGPLGSSRNWRLIPLAKLKNVSTRRGEWHTGQGWARRLQLDWIDVAD